MDRGGTTTAFDQSTGEPRLNVDMQGSAAIVIGNTSGSDSRSNSARPRY
jgi:hypothetical protein